MDSKLSFLKELWRFVKARKNWAIAPLMIFLVLLSFLIIFAEGSVFAPIIYTLF